MKFELIELPIFTHSKFVGMGEAAGQLLRSGLHQAMRAAGHIVTEGGSVPITKLSEDIGPANLRNFESFTGSSEKIAELVSKIENEEKQFLFLGGECSLILGVSSGLQRARKRTLGLLWLDSHGDFNTPETTPSGFIGGMALALACGRGPKMSAPIENHRPAVRSVNVTHAGSRSLDPAERIAMIESGMTLMEMKELRRQGLTDALAKALPKLEDSSDEFILHVDIDCIDPSEIPAVSFPEPGGVSLSELRKILTICGESERLKGIDLTAYNARKDTNGDSAKRIIETFAKGLP